MLHQALKALELKLHVLLSVHSIRIRTRRETYRDTTLMAISLLHGLLFESEIAGEQAPYIRPM